MDDDRMSLRAFARFRKIPVSTAQKALETGRIHRESDETILASKADREWIENASSRVDGRVPVPPPQKIVTMTAEVLAEHFGEPVPPEDEMVNARSALSAAATLQEVMADKMARSLERACDDIAPMLANPEDAKRVIQRPALPLVHGR